jgi:hypothetical protein
MRISLGGIVGTVLLLTSLSLLMIPQSQPFPRQGYGISADVAAMVQLTQAEWRRLASGRIGAKCQAHIPRW